MPNITVDFRNLVESKAHSIPRETNTKRLEKHNDTTYDVFTREAYRIYQHIDSLKHFLLTIRPAYLSTSHRPSRSSTRQTTAPMDGDSLFALFGGNIHNLTDRERDEIDFQAKLIIRRCIDRINELENAEKTRQQQEASKPTHRLAQFLSSVLIPPSTEDVLYVHRSSMTWLLNQQLIKVSQIQKDQQEIRLMREIEKSENQLSKSMYTSTTDITSSSGDYHLHLEQQQPVNEYPFEEQLSKEQVQMLEKENSAMLEEMNNTLNQIKNAEKALLEISTLQSELTNHLAAQTIQTDRLYADAIATTDKVEQGNLQLMTARERNKSSRKFMLAFLIGASFVLLFLDWYS